jgi:hypothetical protein
MADRKKAYPKYRNALDDQRAKTALVKTTIQEAIDIIGPYTAGFGSWTKAVPTTDANTLSKKLDTIKANVGFDKLQDMRSNSPTGGALGQVSEFENKLLQAVHGSLDQEQAAKELVKNLERIAMLYDLSMERNEKALIEDFNEFIPAQDPDDKNTAEEYLKKFQGK